MKSPLATGALVLTLTASAPAEPTRDISIAPLNQYLDEAWMLPVSSSLLRPGTVTPRALDMPGLSPFFLLGGDPRSLSWLRDNAARLRSMNAVGLAVEVADAADLSRIRAEAPGVIILPVNGDDIAARLRIEHYPVLITATGLRQ